MVILVIFPNTFEINVNFVRYIYIYMIYNIYNTHIISVFYIYVIIVRKIVASVPNLAFFLLH